MKEETPTQDLDTERESLIRLMVESISPAVMKAIEIANKASIDDDLPGFIVSNQGSSNAN